MISKITSTNSGSYKKAFNLINAAIAEQKTKRIDGDAYLYDNIEEINSIESFFNNIEAIKRLWVNVQEDRQGNYINGDIGGYMLLMPADEDIFKIDANSREIIVPAKIRKNGIGVYGDHFAEMIVLQIDRYFDGQDLLKTNCAINWSFTPSGAKSSEEVFAEEAFVPNADIDPNYVTFGFIITKEMTSQKKGTLTFSVTFYTKEAGNINYSFNTLTANVTINDTLSLTNATVVKNNISNYLGRLTNSSYNNTTISAVDAPIWQTGEKVDNIYQGLQSVAYLDPIVDKNGNYTSGNGTILTASATTNPNTADIYYRWVFSPIDGTVNSNRDIETKTLATDYFEIALEDMTNDYIYFLKDETGRIALKPITYGSDLSSNQITVTNPLTYDEVNNLIDTINIINNEEDEQHIDIPKFFIKGTSFEALGAGKYQVFAQAHVGSGNYEQLVETPRAGINYYLKNENNEIDYLHPLRNDEAVQAYEEGKVLYVFVGGARNSAEVSSNVCEIPAAKKPNVILGVSSSYQFSDNVIKLNENSEYTYIDNIVIPDITATIVLDSENQEDTKGQFAVQLVEATTPNITVMESSDDNVMSMSKMLDQLSFNDLPLNGTFTSVQKAEDLGPGKFLIPRLEEGEFVVRAFNRRNGTYSISDNSNSIKTSFVAPTLNEITVTALEADGNDNVTVIENGLPAQNEFTNEKGIVELELTSSHIKYDFVIDDSTIQNYADAQINYLIEEVNADGTSRTAEDRAKDLYDPENDIRGGLNENGELDGEVVQDATNPHLYRFSINADPGYYRIKIENRYHDTMSIAYTGMFQLKYTS